MTRAIPSNAADAVNAAMTQAYKVLPHDPAAAARIFVTLCQEWPDSALPLAGLADVQHHLGARPEAEQLLELALKLEPDNVIILNNLAVLKVNGGRREASLPLLQRAHELRPFDPFACSNLVQALRKLQRGSEAFELASAWVQARPDMPDAWHALADCLIATRSGPMAIAVAHRLAALRPDGRSGAMLSRALEANGEYDAAVAVSAEAVALAPDDVEVRAARAVALTSAGQLGAAMTEVEAIKASGSPRETRVLEARIRSLTGPSVEGWRLYEHRFETTQLRLPKVPGKPRWTGEDVAGKRIALWNEQGFGDKIQFARAAWEIVARGGEAIFYFAPTLAPLFTQLPKGIRFASDLKPHEFDMWTTLLSAPAALNDPCPGPNTGYISPPADRAAPAPLRAARSNFRVGLVWAGSPQHDHDDLRSCGLETLAPLLGAAGIDFFALQNGPRCADIAALGLGPFITELAPHVSDWGDTATAIAELDLVITVDTSVAHLAGAMGKPVWVLLQFAPDWRWNGGGATTCWYPSMRLYRQTLAKCWRDPMARVAQDLAALVADAQTIRPRQHAA